MFRTNPERKPAMKSRLTISTALVFGLFTLVAVAADQKAANPDYRISGPYKHKNLAIFLFHGADKLKGHQFLTFSEALEQKVVIVHETGDVNQLAVENVGNVDVYIQSGEIVKGGKQDRTIAFDIIIPAKSGRKPLDAFCVEHGRWQRRGNEDPAAFSGSSHVLASKDLKLAARGSANQQEVWDKVEQQQAKLAENTGKNVRSGQSASSYQLTLENQELQKLTDEYVAALANVVEGKDDVIGYAFAIDGKVNSIDIYASADLFRKLWPKLVRASSVEAIAEGKKDAKYAEATENDVRQCMAEAAKGKQSERAVSDRVKMTTVNAPAAARFDTYDASSGAVVHENYIKK
jgi:hypothetical protein